MANLPLAAQHLDLSEAPPHAVAAKVRTPRAADSPLTVSERADRALLDAARGGDRLAFATLVERHQAAVYSFLRARLLEPADAEDLCQEVFLRSYASPGRVPPQVVVRAWLLGIARNALREHVRRVRRRKEVAWTELCLELDELVQSADDRFDESLLALPACLESLGPSARQALEFHYRARLKLAAIAERLRRSEGAVKLLLFRARQALRSCLEHKRPATHD